MEGIDDYTLFNCVQLQLVSRCNRSCYFCPANKPGYEQPFAYLDDRLLESILAQLAELGFRDKLYPYFMNESMLDKRLPEKIALIRQYLPKVYMMINTNGDVLDKLWQRDPKIAISTGAMLFTRGLNFLCLNAYDDEAQAQRYDELVAELAEVVGGEVTTRGEYQHHGHRRRWLKVMRLYDEPESLYRKRHNNGGLDGYKGAVTEPLVKKCYRPFRQLHVVWTGRVVLCCSDWKHEVVAGDLNRDKIFDVWNGPVLNAYRWCLFRKDRSLPLCRACDFRGGAYLWNLEPTTVWTDKEPPTQEQVELWIKEITDG